MSSAPSEPSGKVSLLRTDRCRLVLFSAHRPIKKNSVVTKAMHQSRIEERPHKVAIPDRSGKNVAIGPTEFREEPAI